MPAVARWSIRPPLLEALEDGRLSGAALDVVENEPQVPGALLRPDVMLTPHVAFSSDASLRELRQRASEEVVRVLGDGAPSHACNEPRQSSRAEKGHDHRGG